MDSVSQGVEDSVEETTGVELETCTTALEVVFSVVVMGEGVLDVWET